MNGVMLAVAVIFGAASGVSYLRGRYRSTAAYAVVSVVALVSSFVG